ncbi:hypothetical protein [Oenococcus oeni]|uniref:hypothetical protein n=1 Tax=Oenococcus oeni TaxID=1247 RepID=UPI0009B59486|nr:hypothetical protein [Oenococcus oeni]
MIQKTAGTIKYKSREKQQLQINLFLYSEKSQNVYFLDIYPKNEKANLTGEEKNKLKVFIKEFKKEL